MPIFGTQTRIFGTEMAQTKPKFMLIEHDRYYYQRKVPLEFQSAIGRKKWREPLGGQFDIAYDRLKVIRAEHDSLIAKLKDPEERRDYKTAKRREREAGESARIAAENATYDRWCRANGEKTEIEEFEAFLEANDLEELPVWDQVERKLEAVEHERNRHKPPTNDDIESLRDLLKRLAHSESEDAVRIELLPHPEFNSLIDDAIDPAKVHVTFERSSNFYQL